MSSNLKLAIAIPGMGVHALHKFGDFLRIPLPCGNGDPVHVFKGRIYGVEDIEEFNRDCATAMKDPRYRSNPRPVTVIAFEEAGERAATGASGPAEACHPTTVASPKIGGAQPEAGAVTVKKRGRGRPRKIAA